MMTRIGDTPVMDPALFAGAFATNILYGLGQTTANTWNDTSEFSLPNRIYTTAGNTVGQLIPASAVAESWEGRTIRGVPYSTGAHALLITETGVGLGAMAWGGATAIGGPTTPCAPEGFFLEPPANPAGLQFIKPNPSIQRYPANSGANSAIQARNLARQLTSEEQLSQALAGRGQPLMGPGTNKVLLGAQRLSNQYGGNPSDWAKMGGGKQCFAQRTI